MLAVIFLPPAEMTADDLDHFVRILKDVTVLESDYLYSVVVQISFSFEIFLFRLFVEMNVAIQFDRESFRWTIEIKNIRAGAMLSAKLSSVNLRSFHECPKCGFGWRQVFS